jgi:hypothetical protein
VREEASANELLGDLGPKTKADLEDEIAIHRIALEVKELRVRAAEILRGYMERHQATPEEFFSSVSPDLLKVINTIRSDPDEKIDAQGDSGISPAP